MGISRERKERSFGFRGPVNSKPCVASYVHRRRYACNRINLCNTSMCVRYVHVCTSDGDEAPGLFFGPCLLKSSSLSSSSSFFFCFRLFFVLERRKELMFMMPTLVLSGDSQQARQGSRRLWTSASADYAHGPRRGTYTGPRLQ